MPFFSRAEIAGFIIAVLGITVMGIIVFTGPYHNINKIQAQSAYPTLHVNIVTATGTHVAEIGIYQPHTISMHVGQSVVFDNISNAAHTVTDDKNRFDSLNLPQRATWTYTAKSPGIYPYHCNYHPLMHGEIVVVH
jgi:plastocyanin